MHIAELLLTRLVSSPIELGHIEQKLAPDLLEHHGSIVAMRAHHAH